MKINIYILSFMLFLLAGCSAGFFNDDLHERVDSIIIEKTDRVGLYLNTAKKAEEQGYTQTAVYLREVAEEEVKHISKLAAAGNAAAKSTQKNLKALYKKEKLAFRSTYKEAAEIARSDGKDETARVLEDMIDDEKRHTAGLNALLKKGSE